MIDAGRVTRSLRRHRPWMADFVARLRESGDVTRSAECAGVSRQRVYQVRRDSELFRQAMDRAQHDYDVRMARKLDTA